MAKGLNKHRQRLDALNTFGKDLARRARSQCEMCGASGTTLQIHEVPKVASEPDFDHCILLCETCKDQLDKPKRIQPDHWRCLNSAVWSEVAAVQVMAVTTLKHLRDQPWATELQEQLYLNPEVEAWLADLD
ncbi:MAG: phnA protein [Pseudomonadota bacterium]